MNWRKTQQQQLRQHLYTTALTLFKDRGFEETTIQAITEAAGIAKGTFFNHFPTKESILVQWMTEVTRQGLADAQSRNGADAVDNVVGIMQSLFKQAMPERRLFQTACRLVATEQEIAATDESMDEAVLSALNQQLDQGLQSGQFSDVLEPDILLPLLLATLTSTAQEWAFGPEGFDFDTTIERRVRYLFQPVLQTPGTNNEPTD